MWFIGVEVEQETSAPPPEKNPGSAPAPRLAGRAGTQREYDILCKSNRKKRYRNFSRRFR